MEWRYEVSPTLEQVSSPDYALDVVKLVKNLHDDTDAIIATVEVSSLEVKDSGVDTSDLANKISEVTKFICIREIEDLSEGLKETVKAVAEELQVKPSVINRAIKIAHKGNWQDHNSDWEEIEAILDITKRI